MDKAADARLVFQCHQTLAARAREVRVNEGDLFFDIKLSPRRMAQLAAAMVAVRLVKVRQGPTMPYLRWEDISQSMGNENTRYTLMTANYLFEKILSPQEWEAKRKGNHRRTYAFDAPFTAALQEELAKNNFSLRQAGEAAGHTMLPQGGQWRLAELQDLQAKQGRKNMMRQALARRQSGAGVAQGQAGVAQSPEGR